MWFFFSGHIITFAALATKLYRVDKVRAIREVTKCVRRINQKLIELFHFATGTSISTTQQSDHQKCHWSTARVALLRIGYIDNLEYSGSVLLESSCYFRLALRNVRSLRLR